MKDGRDVRLFQISTARTNIRYSVIKAVGQFVIQCGSSSVFSIAIAIAILAEPHSGLGVRDRVSHKVVLLQLVAPGAIGGDPLAIAAQGVDKLFNLLSHPELRVACVCVGVWVSIGEAKEIGREEPRTSGVSWMTRFPGL